MSKLTDTEQIALRLIELTKELQTLSSRLVALESPKQPKKKVAFAFSKKTPGGR